MPERPDLRAREAADVLGISLSTLYAYVSRGLIQSRPAGSGSRERLYARSDVEALKERQTQRRDPARVAVTALNWGTLESAITLIENGRLYYRGHDALELARTRTFEEVTGLLWEHNLTPLEILDADAPSVDLAHVAGLDRLTPLERWQVLLPLLQSTDPAAYDLRPAAVRRAGGDILQSVAGDLAPAGGNGRVAEHLARTFAPSMPAATRLIDASLIISADHELNVSSFTVRCVASARAPLYDAIGAGIGALRGVRHGASSYRIEALLDEVGHPGQAAAVLEDRLRRGEPIPGFGHNLYPEGDPRARLLLELSYDLLPDDPARELTGAVAHAADSLIREQPNLDFGLVTVSRGLGLPRGSALTLMALGRIAGWVAHALEQYEVDAMIRPRAKYVGPGPVG